MALRRQWLPFKGVTWSVAQPTVSDAHPRGYILETDIICVVPPPLRYREYTILETRGFFAINSVDLTGRNRYYQMAARMGFYVDKVQNDGSPALTPEWTTWQVGSDCFCSSDFVQPATRTRTEQDPPFVSKAKRKVANGDVPVCYVSFELAGVSNDWGTTARMLIGSGVSGAILAGY